ncbi:MAG: hypothetical protein ABEJ03_06290 [Candidatus Nanohaloarchaea archaeon]
MGVVKRDGKWRLEKKKKGVYLVTENKQVVAKIVTGDYEPQGMMDERSSLDAQVIEVKDFDEAKKEFRNFVEGNSGGGIFGI